MRDETLGENLSYTESGEPNDNQQKDCIGAPSPATGRNRHRSVVLATRMLDDRRKQASGSSGARVGWSVALFRYGISRLRCFQVGSWTGGRRCAGLDKSCRSMEQLYKSTTDAG